MGFVWTKSSPARFAAAIKALPGIVEDQVVPIVDKALADGVADMRETIATSGTGYVGKGARATPEGRIDTGEMYDAVTSRKDGKTSGRFGWINPKKYYGLQEDGFMGPQGPVPPMHSLLKAFTKVRVQVERDLRKLVR